MSRAIKEATVKRYHYDTRDQLRQHFGDFASAHNFGFRFKTFKGLTHYETVCKAWASKPTRFTSDPPPKIGGPNIATTVNFIPLSLIDRSGMTIQLTRPNVREG